MQRMITNSVVSMTLYCSRHGNSRADHENSVSEVAPDLDALIHSVADARGTRVPTAHRAECGPAHGVKG
jgi:hypothetical protein